MRVGDGRYQTDPSWFRHASEGVTMSWEDGEPVLGPLWSPRYEEAFGAPRAPGAEITDRDRDLAASLQAVYEEALFERLRWLQRRTGCASLCLAGGCALNSVANGKVAARTGFREVFIQPAPGAPHEHCGSLHAVDAEQALLNARDVYARRAEGIHLWVVPSQWITASTPEDVGPFFDPANDKAYRHPQFYKTPRGVRVY